MKQDCGFFHPLIARYVIFIHHCCLYLIDHLQSYFKSGMAFLIWPYWKWQAVLCTHLRDPTLVNKRWALQPLRPSLVVGADSGCSTGAVVAPLNSSFIGVNSSPWGAERSLCWAPWRCWTRHRCPGALTRCDTVVLIMGFFMLSDFFPMNVPTCLVNQYLKWCFCVILCGEVQFTDRSIK